MNGRRHRSIAREPDGWGVRIVDQRALPHAFETVRLETLEEACRAIREMRVRGAPLIGVTAAYGVCLALREDPSDDALLRACASLDATRPTGANLAWATGRLRASLMPLAPSARTDRAYELADAMAEEDVSICKAIGRHGLGLLEDVRSEKPGEEPVHVLTHCNAGWLATVDWGTALAPIYMAHDAGLPVHVWVGETRPRNQGSSLTAWELANHGVPHTVVVDNAVGHLMTRGAVDLVVTGADRVTAEGGVFNKVGTYLRALAARDNGVPFYVAVPGPTLDWAPSAEAARIEERDPDEVRRISGRDADGATTSVLLTPERSPAANPAFDFTPPRLVTGLVTERGVCAASRAGLAALYPDRGGEGPGDG